MNRASSDYYKGASWAQKHPEYPVARTLQEAKSPIEAGFDYVTDMDYVKLFRSGGNCPF